MSVEYCAHNYPVNSSCPSCERDLEKKRRIAYQSIVYDVCNALDGANGKSPGTGIVCGDGDNPTHETQIALTALIKDRNRLRDLVAECPLLREGDSEFGASNRDYEKWIELAREEALKL